MKAFLCVLCAALTLYYPDRNHVYAEEGKDVVIKDITFGEVDEANNMVDITFQIENLEKGVLPDSATLEWKSGSDEAIMNLSFDQKSTNYTSSFYLENWKSHKSNTYTLEGVSILQSNGKSIQATKFCSLNSATNSTNCVHNSATLMEKWNYEFEYVNKYDSLVDPDITAINIEIPQEPFELNEDKSFPSNITVSNKEEFSNIYFSAEYLTDQNTFETIYLSDSDFTIQRNFRYKGKNFKLLSINANCNYNNGLYKTLHYSSYSYEELTELTKKANEEGMQNGGITYDFEKENMRSLDTLVKAGTLDFTIANYEKYDTAPVLETIEWSNDTVYLPGYAELIVKSYQKDRNVSVSVRVTTTDEELSNFGGSHTNDTTTIKYVFPRYYKNNSVGIVDITLTDEFGNTAIYAKDPSNSKYSSKNVKQLPEIPDLKLVHTQTYDKILKNGEDGYLDEIKNLADGSTVVLNTLENHIISKVLFDTIKGRNITVIFEEISDEYDELTGGAQWIMNGKDIVKETKDIDVTIQSELYNAKFNGSDTAGWSVGTNGQISLYENNMYNYNSIKSTGYMDYYVELLDKLDPYKDDYMKAFLNEVHKWEAVRLIFKENGELPGKATIRFKPNSHPNIQLDTTGLKAYYESDENTYDLIQDKIDKELDGYYSFNITHNSKYYVTKDMVENLINEKNQDTDKEDKPVPVPDPEPTPKPTPKPDPVVPDTTPDPIVPTPDTTPIAPDAGTDPVVPNENTGTEPEKAGTVSPTSGNESSVKKNSEQPKTSDTTNLGALCLIMMMAAGVAVYTYRRRKS